jgi:hypothetical protein
VKRRVVAVFGPGKPLQPSPRTIASDAAQVHGDSFVHCLGLAIRLWVERRAHPQGDTGEFKQLPPDVAGEDWVAVADDRLREAMESHNVHEERLSDGRCRVGVSKGNEVRIFGKPVDNSEDHALTVNFGKGLDEIHGDVRPNA